MDEMKKAETLLRAYNPSYTFGLHCLSSLGEKVASFGPSVLVFASGRYQLDEILESLKRNGVTLAGGKVFPGARPNAPKEDVSAMAASICSFRPSSILAIGGGSTIDAAKAANVLATLSDGDALEIDSYFGTGKVSSCLKEKGRSLLPLVAVETSASSGSHLTKYANVTDLATGQKKLIVDPAIVPTLSFFDYAMTTTMGRAVTLDGILDALSHTLEVFCGAGRETYGVCRDLCLTTFRLVLSYARRALENPEDLEARKALGLASDLGGVAIMVGGTSGGHLTSFSLVDCTSHGTACGLMNPYYLVFYSKAIQPQLKELASLFASYGYLREEEVEEEGRALSEGVARALIAFSSSLEAPTTLHALPLFEEEIHLNRILSAAKDPDLKMKLQNMPVSMSAEEVDTYMAPILKAALDGDLSLIREKAS